MALNKTLARPGVVDRVTFKFVPSPDVRSPDNLTCVEPAPECECDAVEACALKHAGCFGGCSGAASSALIRFLSCFEGTDKESSCAPAKWTACAAGAGLDVGAIEACRGNATEVASIQKPLAQVSVGIASSTG